MLPVMIQGLLIIMVFLTYFLRARLYAQLLEVSEGSYLTKCHRLSFEDHFMMMERDGFHHRLWH
jgi:hypothetical protein